MDLKSIFRDDICKGRSAIVTGGGSGIGLEIARQLGVFGCSVVILGRDQSRLDEAVVELKRWGVRVIGVRGDVRDPEVAEMVVKKAVSTFGGLDVLVNAAAGNFLAPAEALSTKGFKTVMDIDAVGSFNMCHAAFEPLKMSGRGRIINISATLHYGATWYQTHASAAKAAIDSITRSLAMEWGQHGICVNGVAPGPIADTPGFSKLSLMASEDQIEGMIKAMVPLGRTGTKQEIAAACLFLTSAAGDWITGHTIVVDGGSWLARMNPMRTKSKKVAEESRKVEKATRSKL